MSESSNKNFLIEEHFCWFYNLTEIMCLFNGLLLFFGSKIAMEVSILSGNKKQIKNLLTENF